MAEPPPKPLSALEWESLIDDYSHGGDGRLHRWTSANYSSTPLLDLCMSSLLRKDFSLQLKLNLLTFLEQNLSFLFSVNHFSRLLESLRSVIQSPTDPFSLKDQFLISTTSVFIASSLDDDLVFSTLNDLVELLLTIINRPNHGVDRHTRGIACECLRQLELAVPCLLSDIIPHLWSLCQSERTHVAQSYVLLLSAALLNIVKLKPGVNVVASIDNASIPLIPFNIPQFLIGGGEGGADFVWKEKEFSYRELRRVMAFLLEWPPNLTPFGLMEFFVAILPVAEELDLQASLLRVQFAGLLRTYEPLLYHSFLGMYLKFSSSFQVQEVEVAHRLLFLFNETQHYLVFRLLGLHWLLGFFYLIANKDLWRNGSILDMSLRFYPTIFDSLSMKALKLDMLAYCSFVLCSSDVKDAAGVEVGTEGYEVKLFKDGLVSVSAFKWLPPWSTETAVAFRTLYKFLVGPSSHSDASSTSVRSLIESNVFYALQKFLVDSTSEFRGLVLVTVSCIDRLLGCHKHRWLGEHLLETLDNKMLPKLKIDYSLGSYFPIFEEISENDKVSPSGTLVLLMKFMFFLVEKHGSDSGLKSWYHGSKVLGICRTMLVHHHSSSVFTGLSRLLAFTCLFFPDLEVRENARFYLRMLICVPGKKLRHIMNMGESFPAMTSTPSNSFFSLQSPQPSGDRKGSDNITSYIHVERIIPLLVRQSWSLSLPHMCICPAKPSFLEDIQDNEPPSQEKNTELSEGVVIISQSELRQQKEPLRVMDSRISEIVRVLRRHFSCIPDYRYMTGLKIRIYCTLRFDSEPFCRILGINKATDDLDGVDKLPAIYATVLKFTTAAPYGSISSFQNAFLLGSPTKSNPLLSQNDSMAIVSVDNVHGETFKAPVCIELELREPVPGLVDVFIETNADNGQIIRGQLSSISVGIEDMFMRAILPDDVKGDDVPNYYMELFTALWEACETTSSTGRETFVMKGGKGVTAVNGTGSVKLVEVPITSLLPAVEQYLAPFVVCVIGEPLVDMVKAGGVIKDTVWKDFSSDSSFDATNPYTGPLFLKYVGEEDERGDQIPISRKNIGSIHMLIFLPPRFHLLFQMEVKNVSTLVRIRTDHWPCLAYVDDYLEALFLD